MRSDGAVMNGDDWDNGYARSLGVLLDGGAISSVDMYGGRVTDDSFYVMLNASEIDLEWVVPPPPDETAGWAVELDSSDTHEVGSALAAAATVTTLSHSTLILCSPRTPADVPTP